MTPFTERTLQIISKIPRGKVMTYGQIAGIVEHPTAARQVVRVLHAMSVKYSLPWHRVINAKGHIAIASQEGFQEQKMLLELEGIIVSPEGKIDLERYQWHP